VSRLFIDAMTWRVIVADSTVPFQLSGANSAHLKKSYVKSP
jgi:hypothetical protein